MNNNVKIIPDNISIYQIISDNSQNTDELFLPKGVAITHLGLATT